MARMEPLAGDAGDGAVLIFRAGYVIYAGRAIPSPSEFVYEVARHKPIGVFDTVMEFAQKRSSVCAVAQAMVGLVLQWEDIYQAMYRQATTVIERALRWGGSFVFEAGQPEFDLHYPDASGFAIPALLAGIQKQRQRPALGSVSGARDRRPAILSIDDSPVAQALIQRTLGPSYRLICCGTAQEGLMALESSDDVALLLLDLTLPDMDGLEFCRRVRENERSQDLPIVMLTARDGVVDRLRGRMTGANQYLAKPLPPVRLIAVCQQYLPASRPI